MPSFSFFRALAGCGLDLARALIDIFTLRAIYGGGDSTANDGTFNRMPSDELRQELQDRGYDDAIIDEAIDKFGGG